MRTPRSRFILSLAAVAACVMLMTSAVLAVTDNIIYACVANKDGNLRVISSTGTCKKDEVPLQWNQAGPQGSAGPAGPQGASGASGMQGPTGISGAFGSSGAAGASGAQGTSGTSGPTGAAGATGAPGPQGLSGYQTYVFESAFDTNPGKYLLADCYPKKAVGGGYSIDLKQNGPPNRDNGRVDVYLNAPWPPAPQQWEVDVAYIQNTVYPWSLVVKIVCID